MYPGVCAPESGRWTRVAVKQALLWDGAQSMGEEGAAYRIISQMARRVDYVHSERERTSRFWYTNG